MEHARRVRLGVGGPRLIAEVHLAWSEGEEVRVHNRARALGAAPLVGVAVGEHGPRLRVGEHAYKSRRIHHDNVEVAHDHPVVPRKCGWVERLHKGVYDLHVLIRPRGRRDRKDARLRAVAAVDSLKAGNESAGEQARGVQKHVCVVREWVVRPVRGVARKCAPVA